MVKDHQSDASEPRKEMVSGLPINKAKADFLARLQRSREQLAEYRASGKFQKGE